MAPRGPGRNFCNGASQNGKCSECWPWTGQEVARGWRAACSIVGSLGTPNAGRVWQKKDMTKVESLLHGSMLSDECCFVVAVCCMLLACRKLVFHCFGGINRSAGALCAWLVVGYNYSAEDAVQLLLEKRPSLRPWHNRPYVLEALWKLEGLRAEWHMELSAAGTN